MHDISEQEDKITNRGCKKKNSKKFMYFHQVRDVDFSRLFLIYMLSLVLDEDYDTLNSLDRQR